MARSCSMDDLGSSGSDRVLVFLEAVLQRLDHVVLVDARLLGDMHDEAEQDGQLSLHRLRLAVARLGEADQRREDQVDTGPLPVGGHFQCSVMSALSMRSAMYSIMVRAARDHAS